MGVLGTTMDAHPDEHPRITSTYGYGCEVADIHGYPDITSSLPDSRVVHTVIYCIHRCGYACSFGHNFGANFRKLQVQVAKFRLAYVTSQSHRLTWPLTSSRLL